MKTFNAYVAVRPTGSVLTTTEVTHHFPKAELNRMFRQEILVLLGRPGLNASLSERNEIKSMADLDVVGYIDRSLRRAGFTDPDLDPHVHDILIKMLVTGKLFSGYKTGSFRARFLVTVKNAVRSLLSMQGRRRRQKELSTEVPAAQPTTNDVIEDFRSFLLRQHGTVHLAVLDQRLGGGEGKVLIGRKGVPTSYRLKKIMQEIKQTLQRFAGDDPSLKQRVERALGDESKTLLKRFSRSDG